MGRIIKRLPLIILLSLTAGVLFAEQEAGPHILVHTSPERPVAGSAWTLTLLINHSEPNEVEVLAPHFTGALLLEQVIKSPRSISTGTAAHLSPPEAVERWTAMEYRFALSSPGTVNFDAFTVITPQGQASTAPFNLSVQRRHNAAEIQNYRFVWEGPAELKTGESAVLTLRSVSPGFADSHFADGLFLPPPGNILESIPLTPGEQSAGCALKLRLIPLEAQVFTLAKRQFSRSGAVYEIPALRIPVSQAEAAHGRNSELPTEKIAGQFPRIDDAVSEQPQLYQKHRMECDAVYAAAHHEWAESGAGALAMLRQHERDHPAGAFFAVIRRGAERAMGFTATNDEKKTFFRGKRSAVARETTVRRIPDRAGEETARFREGQPVLLNGKPQKAWLQVIANDDNGASGWVPEENIIMY